MSTCLYVDSCIYIPAFYNARVIPLWAFVAVTVPLVLTPGASTAVVLRNSISGGTLAGVQTAIGANAGSFCYGVLSAFGVALALQHWPSVWVALRAAGIVYLAWLGVRSLDRVLRPREPPVQQATSADDRNAQGLGQNLREGFITNVLNPAIATFYFVVVPQFVPRGAPIVRSVLVLTIVHIGLAGSWHVVWAAAGGTLARTLAGGRPRQILELVAGIALLALAAKLALG
jgi:threonine/homoserine/homoserine lactone efflux protein